MSTDQFIAAVERLTDAVEWAEYRAINAQGTPEAARAEAHKNAIIRDANKILDALFAEWEGLPADV